MSFFSQIALVSILKMITDATLNMLGSNLEESSVFVAILADSGQWTMELKQINFLLSFVKVLRMITETT